MFRRIWILACGVVFLAAAAGLAVEPQGLHVTVEFDGGEVSAEHPIWLFVWDNASFSGSIPIASATLQENGKTASFDSLSSSPVYVTVAYDEKGGYNPMMVGPPPSGTPIGAYVEEGSPGPSPVQLKSDGPTEVRIRFDASFRMP